MMNEIDRREQQILGGVLVKNLRKLVKARIDEKIRGTLLRYFDTPPGPGTKKAVRIEKTRMGLRVYGKGPNRNKLVVHTMYRPANRSNPPKEALPPPIFNAVTSLKAKQCQGNPVLGSTGSTVCIFNPDIPQLTQYKQMPVATARKQTITEATLAPVTPSKRLDHHTLSVAPPKNSKRALFINQADKPDNKKACTEQTETTNSARINREFHKLVVPKIEPADKEPIATLKTKSQAKKTKDSAEDVRPLKK